jgi:hypothetical protein
VTAVEAASSRYGLPPISISPGIEEGWTSLDHEGIQTMRSIFSLVYVVVGFFVAQGQGYLLFDSLPHALSAGAAILLWPLLLLGMNLRLG